MNSQYLAQQKYALSKLHPVHREVIRTHSEWVANGAEITYSTRQSDETTSVLEEREARK